MKKIMSIVHNTLPGGVQRLSAMETVILRKFGYETSLLSILKTQEWVLFEELRIKLNYIFDNEFFGRLFSGLFFNINTSVEPDIIIAHNNPSAQVALRFKQKLKRQNKHVSIVLYLHDSLVYPIKGSLFGEFLSFFPNIYRKLELKYIKKSDIVLVNSIFSLNRVMKNHDLKESSKKIEVLYPTLNVPIAEKKLVKEKKNYMLIVGRIDHEAFYNVYKIMKRVDIPLVVAGYGHPYNPGFRKIVRLFDLLKRKKDIRFVFSPSDEHLLKLYQDALLFVYPGHENFNMSAVEAMSAGCPVLVAETSGVCEIVPPKLRKELCLDKNNTDLWIKRISEVVENNRSYELGKLCWSVTQKYNIDWHRSKLLGILEDLVD
jgi:glycosyltransferase involved in cell wall biosynthesis